MNKFILRTGCTLIAAALAACSGTTQSVPSGAQSTQSVRSAPSAASHSGKRGESSNARWHKHMQAGVPENELAGYAQDQLRSDSTRDYNWHHGHGHHYGNGGGHHGGPRHSGGYGNGSGSGSGGTQFGTAKALVLYDTSGQWGFLGELYAMGIANLCGHFGTADTEAVTDYRQGQIDSYDTVIYAGSTYYDTSSDPVPAAFYNDVMGSSKPVIWMNDNIWNMAAAVGPAAFENRYGWDATTSYFAPGGSVGDFTQVMYKDEPLTRTIPAGGDGGILQPNLTNPAQVTVLASAVDGTSGATVPWMIRSANLTYIGEIPFEYTNETDRIIAFEDVLYDVLAPSTPQRHRALVRLEDVNAEDDPNQLLQIAQYLWNQHIPYGVNVIPHYLDPNGYYNNGVPVSLGLKGVPQLVQVLTWITAHGGTLIDEGYTHQYSNVANPYSGVSGDDAEFYLAHVDSANNVVWDGPIPQDSASWAQGRLASAAAEFKGARLAFPSLWVTPHYFASDVDYSVISAAYHARYERSLYFSGYLSGSVDHAQYIGEFFPYPVRDVYGGEVIPENLGDYEPVPLNNHPTRFPADIVNAAKLNLAVRDGFASFFYDPTYGLGPLQQTIQGIQGLGYTFVDPGSL